MTMAGGETIHGRCLCGAVSFDAAALAPEMGVCHCSQCRRWSSGVFSYVSVDPKSFAVSGDRLGVYGSSETAERGFCTVCGSSLFWRTVDGGEVDVSAQALDDPARFPFTVEVHLDDKPANYAFANRTLKYPGGTDTAPVREALNG